MKPELSDKEQRRKWLQVNGPKALRRILHTPGADVAMEFIDQLFKPDLPAFIIQGDLPLDPLKAAVRDGQTNVVRMLQIYHKQGPPTDNDAQP
jgi:hypothetical protein